MIVATMIIIGFSIAIHDQENGKTVVGAKSHQEGYDEKPYVADRKYAQGDTATLQG